MVIFKNYTHTQRIKLAFKIPDILPEELVFMLMEGVATALEQDARFKTGIAIDDITANKSCLEYQITLFTNTDYASTPLGAELFQTKWELYQWCDTFAQRMKQLNHISIFPDINHIKFQEIEDYPKASHICYPKYQADSLVLE